MEPEGIVNVPFVVKRSKPNEKSPAPIVGCHNTVSDATQFVRNSEELETSTQSRGQISCSDGADVDDWCDVLQHPLEVLDRPHKSEHCTLVRREFAYHKQGSLHPLLSNQIRRAAAGRFIMDSEAPNFLHQRDRIEFL